MTWRTNRLVAPPSAARSALETAPSGTSISSDPSLPMKCVGEVGWMRNVAGCIANVRLLCIAIPLVLVHAGEGEVGDDRTWLIEVAALVGSKTFGLALATGAVAATTGRGSALKPAHIEIHTARASRR